MRRIALTLTAAFCTILSATAPAAELGGDTVAALLKGAEHVETMPEAYSGFPNIKLGKANLEIERRGEVETMPLRINTKVSSDGQLLLIESMKTEDGSRISTDVITFKPESRTYKVLRAMPGGGVMKLTGIGNWSTREPEVNKFGDQIALSGVVEGGEFGGSRVVGMMRAYAGRERFPGSLTWQSAVFMGEKTLYREKVSYYGELGELATAKPPERKSGLAGALGKLFGGGKKEAPKPMPGFERQDEYRFEEMNFRFAHPEGSYRRMDPKLWNSPAALVLMESAPLKMLMIIAEDGSALGGLGVEQVLTIAKAQIQGVATDVEFGPQKKTTHEGMEFTTVTSLGKTGVAKNCWCHAIAIHNGWIYQLVFSRRTSDAEAVRSETLEMLKNFHLIDPERRAGANRPALAYEAPEFGVSVDLAGLGWAAWPPEILKISMPSGTFGAQTYAGRGLTYLPVDLTGLDPDDRSLAVGLFTALGLKYPDEIGERTPHKQGSASGEAFTARVVGGDGDTYNYRIRLLRNGDTACLIAAFASVSDKDAVPQLEKALDRFEFEIPKRSAETAKGSGVDQIILNEIGIDLYNRGRIDGAVAHLRATVEREPATELYFTNLIQVMSESGLVGEALEEFDKHAGHFENDLGVLANRPALLSSLGRNTEAADAYGKLFKRGLRNEDQLLLYLGVLIDLNRSDDAIATIDRFVGDGSKASVRTRRWQHQIYSQAGDTQRALVFAQQLSTEFPDNPQIAADLVVALLDDEQPDKALAKIATLRDAGGDPLVLNYNEGRARMMKKEYQKAKDVLERASSVAPGRPRNGGTAQHGLRHARTGRQRRDQKPARTRRDPRAPREGDRRVTTTREYRRVQHPHAAIAHGLPL